MPQEHMDLGKQLNLRNAHPLSEKWEKNINAILLFQLLQESFFATTWGLCIAAHLTLDTSTKMCLVLMNT